MQKIIPSLVILSLASIVLALPRNTQACGVAPPPNVVVEVASESAIIVWDAQSKTQHFIRRATFSAAAKGAAPVKDFGFLVPTPTQPTLAEVDDKAFDELAKITAPKTEYQKTPSGGGCAMGCGASAPKSRGSAVEVLEEKRVAGYDAKVLKATDAAALTAWLNDRGYELRPALTSWLKHYVDKGWVVTAFKIARDPTAPAGMAIGTSAVRMSFTTDTPIFPYREPDDMHDAKTKRLLRVFFLGGQKMDGMLGDTPWPGKVAWAGKLTAENGTTLSPLLNIPGYTPKAESWLTEFEDHASPRPGSSDLTFVPNLDQNPVERPSRIVYTARSDAGGRAGFAIFALGIVGVLLGAAILVCREKESSLRLAIM